MPSPLNALRLGFVLLAVFSLTLMPGVAAAQDQNLADLEEQLKNGLLARNPNELEFIAKVVDLVDAGTLDRATVMAAFKYARPKKPRPFPYFQRAVTLLAKDKGVDL